MSVSPITQLCSDPAYYVLDGNNLYQNGWFFIVGEGTTAAYISMQPYISGYMVAGNSSSISVTYFSGANLFFLKSGYAYEGYYYYRIFWLNGATPYPTPGCI